MKAERVLLKFLVLLIAILFVSCTEMETKSGSGEMAMEQGGTSHDMTMHHQHQTMNHALGMILDGSNLTMLGQMSMLSGIDEITVDHGDMMMNNGSDLWNSLMSGDEMMKMHKAGTTPQDDPLMKFTHELAEAQLKVINMLKSHADNSDHIMATHHQHILMNHALKMAMGGSDLTITGQMGMAPGVDEVSVEHGKKMRKNAWDMLNEVLSGDEMMKMHEEGMKPTSDQAMEYTHKLGSAIMKVMSLLDKMPGAM
jgi:hypothetical protein